jgi:hypothetical protein
MSVRFSGQGELKMRALTMDEVRFVSGGAGSPAPAPKPDEKPKQDKKDDDGGETVVVFGFRAPNGVGVIGGGGWLGGGFGVPGPVIKPVKPADPENPKIELDIEFEGVDVRVPVNTSPEARWRFWNRAFGTPRAAIQ